MRISIISFFIILLVTKGFSQVIGGTNEKLAKLYNQGKYESCLFKADNLTYKEGSSRDPEPYLYMALCFYELSQSEDEFIREDYKDGLKQAIKYAAKFTKKDKDKELYNSNLDFIEKLRGEQKKKIKQELNNNKYRKAASSAKLYNQLNIENDFAIIYLIGMCEMLSNNYSQGPRNMEKGKEKLDEMLENGTFKPDPKIKPLLIDVFLKYSEFLVNDNKAVEAEKILAFALKLFPNDGYIKVQYNLIKKAVSPQE